MVLSEAEAEAQLAGLRRQRETLDRAIADLSLYLELGRRLTGGAVSIEDDAVPPVSVAAPRPLASQPGPWPSPDREDRAAVQRGGPDRQQAPGPSVQATRGSPAIEADGVDTGVRDGALSEGVLARRHGRALIEAALSVLEEAGRPLHAGEILTVLTARGFSLPGHDPIAALNTRLWKRSGPGGPLRRMGDAVYALAEPGGESGPGPRP